MEKELEKLKQSDRIEYLLKEERISKNEISVTIELLKVFGFIFVFIFSFLTFLMMAIHMEMGSLVTSLVGSMNNALILLVVVGIITDIGVLFWANKKRKELTYKFFNRVDNKLVAKKK